MISVDLYTYTPYLGSDKGRLPLLDALLDPFRLLCFLRRSGPCTLLLLGKKVLTCPWEQSGD